MRQNVRKHTCNIRYLLIFVRNELISFKRMRTSAPALIDAFAIRIFISGGPLDLLTHVLLRFTHPFNAYASSDSQITNTNILYIHFMPLIRDLTLVDAFFTLHNALNDAPHNVPFSLCTDCLRGPGQLHGLRARLR